MLTRLGIECVVRAEGWHWDSQLGGYAIDGCFPGKLELVKLGGFGSRVVRVVLLYWNFLVVVGLSSGKTIGTFSSRFSFESWAHQC